jgi:hypothetical protein
MNNELLTARQSPIGGKVFSRSPVRVTPVRAKIETFGKLEEGWDFGEGGPAPPHVVEMALALCDLGERLAFEMDAFPGAGGDISVDFYLADELVQILINTDLSLDLTHESGIGFEYDEVAYHENISFQDFVRYLFKFRAKGYVNLWTSSERFTETSTRRGSSGFIQTVSRTLTKPYLSLRKSVYGPPARTFATI